MTLTASLKFGETWKNFGEWKKSFAPEMSPINIFFFAKHKTKQNKTKFCIVLTGPYIRLIASGTKVTLNKLPLFEH